MERVWVLEELYGPDLLHPDPMCNELYIGKNTHNIITTHVLKNMLKNATMALPWWSSG